MREEGGGAVPPDFGHVFASPGVLAKTHQSALDWFSFDVAQIQC